MKHEIIETVKKIKRGLSIAFGSLILLVIDRASIYLSPEQCVFFGNKLVEAAKQELDAIDESNVEDRTWVCDIYVWGKALQMNGEMELRGGSYDADEFIKELSIHMAKVRMKL